MVFQIVGVVALPIIMMIVLGPPPEHLFTQEVEEDTPDNIGDLFFAFFVMWIIWILIMTRIAIQKRKGTLNIRRGF